MNFCDMTWTMTMAKCPCCKSHLAYSSDNNYNTWKCYSCGFTMFKQRSEQMMTREEAIEILKAHHMWTGEPQEIIDVRKENKAIEMAIHALSQEPCDDAISRKDAEQMFGNIRCHLKPQDYKSAEEFNTRDLMLLNAEQMIHALPSVTQKPKTGHWIEHPEIETSAPEYLMFYECSECGDRQCFCKSDIHKKRFCSNCGCRMVEPQESEDKE